MSEEKQEVEKIVTTQRRFFNTGKTYDVSFRLQQLTALENALHKYETEIILAAKQDLSQPEAEIHTVELITIFSEITRAKRHLQRWMKPKRITTPLLLFPGSSWVYPEPRGCVLIIGPWNHPFQLLLSPFVGALAAGNCVVLKPSEIAQHSSKVIATMIEEFFDPSHVAVIEGGANETQELLAQRFDHIFFTGGTRVGRIIMSAAARHLTSVTLELGGKNPCIVDSDANLEKAARRIVWGKFVNAGQNCIAPDYLLVHHAVKQPLLELIQSTITTFFGDDPIDNPDYGRIINAQHLSRLSNLLQEGEIVIGGTVDAVRLYISPTVIDQVTWEHPIMQEEIFGPILPVLVYDDLNDVITLLQGKPKPLGLYFFSQNRLHQDKVLQGISSGGACINDTFAQILNQRLPFGGVGESGMGAYHGKAGFDTFTHYKGVVRRSNWLDPGYKYPPYTISMKIIKKYLRYLF